MILGGAIAVITHFIYVMVMKFSAKNKMYRLAELKSLKADISTEHKKEKFGRVTFKNFHCER